MSKRPLTFLETGIQRAGIRNTVKGLAWSSMWATVRLDLGREPTFNEVRDWWALSNAHAFKYQQAYRRCWPPHARSPWILTQCAIEQKLTTERRLRAALKFTKAFKGVGMTVAQREALVDQYAQIVGMAAAA
jgi:hypothetical protein